jgi:hypothetical protein
MDVLFIISCPLPKFHPIFCSVQNYLDVQKMRDMLGTEKCVFESENDS